MMDRTAAFYSEPSYHYRGAGGFPVFSGSRRQRGGGILGSLAKLVMPVLKNVGKVALGQAAGLARDVMNDVAAGGNFRQSLKQHGIKRLRNTTVRGLSGLRASGKRQDAVASHKQPPRKRSLPSRKQPPRKKLRQALF